MLEKTISVLEHKTYKVLYTMHIILEFITITIIRYI